MGRLDGGEPDRPHPLLLAGPSVEAIEVSLPALVFGAGDENPPVRDDGAAVAGSGERRLPPDVLIKPPAQRGLILIRDAVSRRPAERRPIS